MKMKDKLIEIKRGMIIDAAKSLLFEKGYENTSIDEIAQLAGISKSTLYTYFLSKEEILIRVFVRASIESEQDYIDAVKLKTTGYDKLFAYSLTIYECYESQPEYLKLYDIAIRILRRSAKLGQGTTELTNDSGRRIGNLLREIFALGLEDKTFRQDLNIDFALSYYLDTIQNITKLVILSSKFTKDDYFTAVEYFLRGFKNNSI